MMSNNLKCKFPIWQNQPFNLTSEEIEAPYKVMEDFFGFTTLKNARDILAQWLVCSRDHFTGLTIFWNLHNMVEKLLYANFILLGKHKVIDTTGKITIDIQEEQSKGTLHGNENFELSYFYIDEVRKNTLGGLKKIFGTDNNDHHKHILTSWLDALIADEDELNCTDGRSIKCAYEFCAGFKKAIEAFYLICHLDDIDKDEVRKLPKPEKAYDWENKDRMRSAESVIYEFKQKFSWQLCRAQLWNLMEGKILFEMTTGKYSHIGWLFELLYAIIEAVYEYDFTYYVNEKQIESAKGFNTKRTILNVKEYKNPVTVFRLFFQQLPLSAFRQAIEDWLSEASKNESFDSKKAIPLKSKLIKLLEANYLLQKEREDINTDGTGATEYGLLSENIFRPAYLYRDCMMNLDDIHTETLKTLRHLFDWDFYEGPKRAFEKWKWIAITDTSGNHFEEPSKRIELIRFTSEFHKLIEALYVVVYLRFKGKEPQHPFEEAIFLRLSHNNSIRYANQVIQGFKKVFSKRYALSLIWTVWEQAMNNRDGLHGLDRSFSTFLLEMYFCFIEAAFHPEIEEVATKIAEEDSRMLHG